MNLYLFFCFFFFFFQAEDGIRDKLVTGVQTCALPISSGGAGANPSWRRPRRAILPPRRAPWRAARAAVRTPGPSRSEERRVGKEWRTRWSPDQHKKKIKIILQTLIVSNMRYEVSNNHY